MAQFDYTCFPSSFLGCCDVLGISDTITMGVNGYFKKELESLQKLIICRNAYWKIAGEQMGLGKSWSHDWLSYDNIPAVFMFRYNMVVDSVKFHQSLFYFPTTEMTMLFHNNFKDLMEDCKEFIV